MCDLNKQTVARYPRDFECINGVAIDIDCYIEGEWDDCFPAPCHPNFCHSCLGSGEVDEDGGAVDCDDCNGTGFTNGKDDTIERLEEHSAGDCEND